MTGASSASSFVAGSPLRYDGKVVIVTGAGRGIGRAHALALADRGAMVVVNDAGVDTAGASPSSGPADDVAHEIVARGGRAVASTHSVAEQAGAAAIVATALDHFGRIDAVVNNAGIQVRQPIGTVDEATFRRQLDVHLLGTFLLASQAWPHLQATRGSIVNTLSGLLFGMEGYAGYAAAKGGIFGLSRTLAAEGEPVGISVNCVVPGAATRMMTGGDMPAETVSALEKALPAAAVAEVVAYLAHPSCTLNGECIAVTGDFVSRYVLAETKGMRFDSLTAEAVASSIDTIMDTGRLDIWKDTPAAIAGCQVGGALNEVPNANALSTSLPA